MSADLPAARQELVYALAVYGVTDPHAVEEIDAVVTEIVANALEEQRAAPALEEEADDEAAHTVEETAYHEAGHAVASIVLKRRFKSVSIEPNDDDQSFGRVTLSNSQDIRDRLESNDLDELVRRGTILAAGAAAADRYTNRRTRGGGAIDLHGSDQYQMGDLVGQFSMDGRDQIAFASWVRLRAEWLVADIVHWAMIQGVATALLSQRRLTERQTRDAAEAGLEAMRRAPPTPLRFR